jgi:formamidopyrimidine-DNA glycosylase
MPELPEVESLRRSLIPFVVGQKILSVLVHKPKLVAAKGTVRVASEAKTNEFITELKDQKIIEIQRIAKNLLFKFESGKIMLVHLKMTGQLVYQSKNEDESPVFGGHPIDLAKEKLPSKHSHIIFELEDGTLYFNDTRMFGYVLYFPNMQALEAEEHFKDLGIDPFDTDFTLENFKKGLLNRKSKLKSVFLSQEVVIGLGNIYADEVCFEAGVRPDRLCNSLKPKEIQALYQAILRIIPLAVDLGGSSIANYLLADGSRGNYAREHKVYNRGGKPCFVCGNTLEKMVINSRTTVFCPKCQK